MCQAALTVLVFWVHSTATGQGEGVNTWKAFHVDPPYMGLLSIGGLSTIPRIMTLKIVNIRISRPGNGTNIPR